MRIKVNLTKQLQPLLKSARKVGRVISEESARAARTISDIESGKLEIIATVTVKKKK